MRTNAAIVKITDRERFKAAENHRLARLAKTGHQNGRSHLSQDSGPSSSTLDPKSWRTRSLGLAQAYWWVPAGFAVLVLLRTIIGG